MKIITAEIAAKLDANGRLSADGKDTGQLKPVLKAESPPNQNKGELTVDNFEKYALRNEEKGDRRYARELRDAGKIVRRLVRKGLAQGWTISVYDSEEWTVKRSTDAAAIMEALFTTDSDTVRFRDADGEGVGSVALIYGNAGYEVIADYSATPEMTEFMEREIDPYVLSIEAGA